MKNKTFMTIAGLLMHEYVSLVLAIYFFLKYYLNFVKIEL